MKWWIHLVVWIVLFALETLIYWAGRFWVIETFQEAFMYNLVINIPKIAGTYILLDIIQVLKPRLDRGSTKSWVIIFVYVALWLVIYRLVLNFIAWPVAFGVFPLYEPFSIPLNSFSFFKMITPLGVLFFLQIMQDRNASQEKIKALERSRLETELKYLRNQFNPHFLFNTLNNIYVLARGRSEQTAPAIARLSHILRTMLYETTEDRITLEKELELIDHYRQLEQLRYGDRLQCNVRCNSLDKRQRIPAFLLLNFVENAFKHSSLSSAERIHIDIELQQKNATLSFSCSNPTVQNGNTQEDGIGLKNTRRRLELYFPERHVLKTGTHEGRYLIDLKLAMNEA